MNIADKILKKCVELSNIGIKPSIVICGKDVIKEIGDIKWTYTTKSKNEYANITSFAVGGFILGIIELENMPNGVLDIYGKENY